MVSDFWIFKYECVLTSFIHPYVSGYTVISDLDLHQADYVITNTLCESMSVCVRVKIRKARQPVFPSAAVSKFKGHLDHMTQSS